MCISHYYWTYYAPDDCKIFIVDDASENGNIMANYRFPERVGIPSVKNKCIELAYDWGADYFFLSDDDCYPIAPFAEAYINSGIHHLSYSFTEPYDSTSARTRKIVKHNGKDFYSYSKPNGCMKFFTRHAIDAIGGYDTRYGLGMYEDVEITRRAYNAGLTPFPNMDIIGSDKLFHSMDRFKEVERTFSKKERSDLTNKGAGLWDRTKNSKEYTDFRNI